MIGFGYDSHKLVSGKPLIIGGENIVSEFGTIAHSDGDVVLHALCDAMLGACGLGDIGELFPDTNPIYKGVVSRSFVTQILKMIIDKDLYIVNVDVTIILEKPKLKNYKEKIKKNISEMLNISSELINIKAKTNEGMGFIGRLEGIAAFCVCEIQIKA
ncbi:MAG: 2-C-methyl-D-erythritol 2,4-cyclodiphosphate synthase [Ignavibacteriae bacterium]|nr:2-C-methyl-D-erythritol 2,4-cyclodiphosphate synthase [Ignavibacteriota bacterium]